jgi:hypothetical protein
LFVTVSDDVAKTYDHKDRIKELGFRFSRDNLNWYIRADRGEHIDKDTTIEDAIEELRNAGLNVVVKE